MDTKTIIETAEEKLIHTYNRYQIVLDKGDGVRLYDTDGKEYLDFGAGIAVFALGYNNKEYNDAVKAQVDKLIHTSNYFYNEPAVKAAQAVTKASGMDRVFFTNSGTEAVEGAIKLAKKYAYLKDGSTDHEIIAMEHSFHGRSMGALAVTGNRHYQEAFGPMIPGIKFAKYNDLESVKSLVNDKTCAIIFETVQGEGGVYPANKEFIEGVRKLCDEKGILLILDEIQCGITFRIVYFFLGYQLTAFTTFQQQVVNISLLIQRAARQHGENSGSVSGFKSAFGCFGGSFTCFDGKGNRDITFLDFIAYLVDASGY